MEEVQGLIKGNGQIYEVLIEEKIKKMDEKVSPSKKHGMVETQKWELAMKAMVNEKEIRLV